MNMIGTASREYYKRPADERFASLDALIDHKMREREMSREAVYNLRDLRVVADEQTLRLESPKGQATFSHYSFGQLCSTVKAPAGYVRSLPPTVAADALNYGLHDAAPFGTRANVLIKDDPTQPFPVARACTSDTYGRVWDAELAGTIRRHFGDGRPSAGGGTWMQPPVWPNADGTPGKPNGSNAGDRDSFILRCDGGSIVTDPSAGQGEGSQLYRAIMVRNSEVGHCSISIDCVLYRYICGNHMLWGAVMDRQFRRRHVGKRAVDDTMRELLNLAHRFSARSASTDQALIQTLIDHEIASTKDAVIDELRALGMNQTEAAAAYATTEQTERSSPRSYWGLAQGITRMSQEDGYEDTRLRLDQIAASIISKGAKQYATV